MRTLYLYRSHQFKGHDGPTKLISDEPASGSKPRGLDLGIGHKHLGAIDGRKSTSRKVEEIGNLIVDGEETPDLSRRLQLLHDPLVDVNFGSGPV